MKSPFTGGKVRIEKRWKNWPPEKPFRKETFRIYEHVYVCEDTGNEFSADQHGDDMVDLDATYNWPQVYNQYRARHHIPFPDEIKAIRLQYGLSASKMSEVLDLGINSFRNYEHGEVPSLANAKLIRLAKEPKNFRSFVEEKKHVFTTNGYKKVQAKLDALVGHDDMVGIVNYIWNFHMEANAFTGFVKPNFEKVAHFVLFFAEKLKPLKTKLNKLLFYSDFLHFKETCYAISGCNYRAIQLGPVPSHFSELFGILESEGYVNIEHEVLEKGVGERFMPAKSFNPELFSESELAAMTKVADLFKDHKTTEIVNISHNEEGWIANQNERELIDYQEFAFKLKEV